MKKLTAALAVLGAFAPSALAAGHYLRVSPSTVKAGRILRLYGSVGTACPAGDQVTILSLAFKGATAYEFAEVPALYTTVGPDGAFSTKVTLKRTIKPAGYYVGARCAGSPFSGATLTVKKA